MSLFLNNDIPVNTLLLKTEIVVWHAYIPDILRSVCRKGTYHNFRQMVNEIFQKTDFDPDFLNPQEITTLNRFKALKKQVEWFCGRFLLKSMLCHDFLSHKALSEIFIDYMDEGAPFIASAPDIPISLSHSNDCTVAAAASAPDLNFGIDIEKITEKPDAWFMKTAFTRREIEYFKESAEDIFTAWTVKEAYLKYIKKGFNESLHRVEVLNGEIFHNGIRMNLDVTSVLIDGYALSLVSDR